MSTRVEPCTAPTEPGIYIARRPKALKPTWMVVKVEEGVEDLVVRFIIGDPRAAYGLDQFEFRERIVIE